MTTAYTQISTNRAKTFFIMFFFAAFVVLVAYIFTLALGYSGPGAFGFLGIVLVISGLINLGSYYYSDRLVMAVSGAKRIEKKDNPQLFRTVENLSIAAGAPMPKVYIIDDDAPNALATGRNPQHAAIAITTGLLSRLEKLELEGVIAHELSHIQNYDTRVMTIVVILVGLVILLSDIFIRTLWFGGGRRDRSGAGTLFLALGILAAVIAPIAAQLIRLAISRKREFLADASGALLTRHPDGLAGALVKIAAYTQPARRANSATAHLYISNPFGSGRVNNWFIKLFNTHPPIEERIKILRAM